MTLGLRRSEGNSGLPPPSPTLIPPSSPSLASSNPLPSLSPHLPFFLPSSLSFPQIFGFQILPPPNTRISIPRSPSPTSSPSMFSSSLPLLTFFSSLPFYPLPTLPSSLSSFPLLFPFTLSHPFPMTMRTGRAHSAL